MIHEGQLVNLTELIDMMVECNKKGEYIELGSLSINLIVRLLSHSPSEERAYQGLEAVYEDIKNGLEDTFAKMKA
jgi:hypothetical protein